MLSCRLDEKGFTKEISRDFISSPVERRLLERNGVKEVDLRNYVVLCGSNNENLYLR